MEIREFAERIVLGTTLEDKLADCGPLFDEHPGGPVPAIRLPGRPDELSLHHDTGAMPAPGITQIHSERDRGILLHFLANHELLATELMALVLLKFPNAPAAFRRGVLHTLKEEQAHTRLYLHRMQACGVAFGEFPLSGYFWRMVEPMESPLDFVARLSLTFEQANLDYSKFYAGAFAEAGDRETASILQAIYQDEITHVRHGLEWFRQWKDDSQSDWEAYRTVLHFPLSPARAKATAGPFNRKGRTAAGLDEAFIDGLELFRQSRGRMPVVRWFHPGAEADLCQAPTLPTPSTPAREHAVMDQVAGDLESLLFPLSAEDDVVLMRSCPSNAFRRQLIDAKLPLPEILPWPAGDAFTGHPLLDRKLDHLAPWAWTPTSIQQAEALRPLCHRPAPEWNPDRAEPFKKSWATRLLKKWLKSDPGDPSEHPADFTGPEATGHIIQSPDQVEEALGQLASHGCDTALFKVDLGTAGRGQRRLDCHAPIPAKDLAIITAAMRGQSAAVVEPWLDRVVDISLQWTRDARDESGLRFLGWTRQLIQPGRRYLGSVIGKPFDDLPVPLKRFLLEDRCGRLRQLEAWLRPRLDTALASAGHTGPVGVDCLVARQADGGFRIKPVVEINPRHTMGQVALGLEKRIAPGGTAHFLLLTKRHIHDLGYADFATFAETIVAQHPPRLDPRFGLRHGVALLADPEQAQVLLPVLAVGNTAIKALTVQP